MKRVAWPIAICLVLSACGDSSMNPRRWFGGEPAPRGPATLTPEKGYTQAADERLPVAQILSARWEPTLEGRLLVVTALAPTQGWWDVALVTQTPQASGELRPDPDGVLRLRLVGAPPPQDSPSARTPVQPEVDTLTVALPLSHRALSEMASVEVAGGANAISLGI